jgi:hypothetical protein
MVNKTLFFTKNPSIFAARLVVLGQNRVDKAEVRLEPRSFSEGAVAQLVEQRTENPCVGGSIPPHTTKRLNSDVGSFLFFRE